MRLEGLGKLKKSDDLIGHRNGNLPACSIVPQPTTLPRTPMKHSGREIITTQLDSDFDRLSKLHALAVFPPVNSSDSLRMARTQNYFHAAKE
jgi:hypothetical protein